MNFDKIAEYKVLKKIGEGNMGAVFKAQTTEGQVVAIKVISNAYSDNKMYVQRFMREVQVASKLDHRNIVKTLDYGLDFERDILFAVMEYVPGVSLDEVIKKEKSLPIKDALVVVTQVARGLQCAEVEHVVHRDIKPGNIQIDSQGVVKILDFGLVKDTEEETLTETGMALGSPAYMSPEQVKGEKNIDIRSDVYSLGIVLFRMITGDLPYKSKFPVQVMLMHTTESLPPLKKYLGEEGKAIQPVLDKMTKKNRDQRHTPTSLLRELKERFT